METTETRGGRSLDAVILETREHLVQLGYGRVSLKHFGHAWSKLAQFAADRGVASLSVDLAEAFLLHCGVGSSAPEAPAASGQQHLIKAMRYLLEFQQHGCIQRRPSVTKVQLPDVLSHIVEAFVRFCTEERGIRPRSIRGRRRNVTAFLMYLTNRGTSDVRSIGIETVSGFVTSLCHLIPRTLATVRRDGDGTLVCSWNAMKLSQEFRESGTLAFDLGGCVLRVVFSSVLPRLP